MYSYPIPKESKNILFRIFINDKEYNTFKLLKEEGDIIRFNLKRFSQLKDENKKDKFYYVFNRLNEITLFKEINNKLFNYQNLDDETFANWLKDYLQNSYKGKITSLKVYKANLNYDHNQKLTITDNILLLNMDYDSFSN
jgi:hypothetical protein